MTDQKKDNQYKHMKYVLEVRKKMVDDALNDFILHNKRVEERRKQLQENAAFGDHASIRQYEEFMEKYKKYCHNVNKNCKNIESMLVELCSKDLFKNSMVQKMIKKMMSDRSDSCKFNLHQDGSTDRVVKKTGKKLLKVNLL